MVLDIRQLKGGPKSFVSKQKCIDYIEKGGPKNIVSKQKCIDCIEKRWTPKMLYPIKNA